MVYATTPAHDLLIGLIERIELVFQKLLSVRVVFCALREHLAEGKVLVESGLSLCFKLQDVAEARVESDFSAPVETDLRAADIRMGQVLTVHIVDCTQNLLSQRF